MRPGSSTSVNPVLADEHEQCGADSDQGVSAQPGILLADFPFQADARGQDQGEGEFPGLPPSLAIERACGAAWAISALTASIPPA